MKPPIIKPKIGQLRTEILILKQHLECVTILGLRKQIEQQIEQKEASINLRIQKALAKHPEAPQKTVDREAQRIIK